MGRNQWIAVLVSVAFVVGLYVWGETTHLKDEEKEDIPTSNKQSSSAKEKGINWPSRIKEAEQQLSDTLSQTVAQLKKAVNETESDSSHESALQNIAHFWKHNQYHDIAGYYFERLAHHTEKQPHWESAGDAYRFAFQRQPDSLRPPLARKAIHSYKKALSLSSGDPSVKLKLATSYTDGTKKVMKGVELLLDIVEKDSTHTAANFHLGRLAIRSGQYDKAVSRLNTVVSQDSTHYRGWLLLGQAQLSRGEKEKAVSIFRKTKSFVKDSSQRKELNNYIQEIINS